MHLSPRPSLSVRQRLFNALRRGQARRHIARQTPASVGSSQSLEDRTMLTTFSVDTPLDNFDEAAPSTDGLVSLREAILAANSDSAVGDAPAGSGFDTIQFDNTVFSGGGTITLAQGELTVTEGVDIDAETGLTAIETITLDGAGAFRVLNIDVPNVDEASSGLPASDPANLVDNVQLRSLVITNGFADNGAGVLINGGGEFRGLNLTVTGNTATGTDSEDDLDDTNGTDTTGGGGGGIYIEGGTRVQLNDSTVSTNTVAEIAGDGDTGSGGGIFNQDGRLFVYNTDITGNTASRAGGGIEVGVGTTYLFETDLSGNDAGDRTADVLVDPTLGGSPGNGGGLHVTGSGAQTFVVGGTVNNNFAASEGGGLWNQAGSSLRIRGNISGDAMITNNVAAGAAADNGGGGVFNNGGRTYVGSLQPNGGVTVSGNSASGASGSGGGIFSTDGPLTVVAAEVTGNTAVRAGGGIEVSEGTLRARDINLSYNDAGDRATTEVGDPTRGGNPGSGGGLHISGGARSFIVSSTVDNNFAALAGGGLWNGTGIMSVRDTDVTNNVAAGDEFDAAVGPFSGGGGLYNAGGNLSISDSAVTGNTALGTSGSGGGILSVNGVLGVIRTTVAANAAARAGGGVEVIGGADGGSNSNVFFVDAILGASDSGSPSDLSDDLVGNEAGVDDVTANPGNGGGLHTTGTVRVRMRGGSVLNNVAQGQGGGLWFSSATSAAFLTSADTSSGADGEILINGNLANTLGGGIYNLGTLNVGAGVVTQNVADADASMDDDLGDGVGGGIYAAEDSLADITDAVVASNTPDDLAGPGQLIV